VKVPLGAADPSGAAPAQLVQAMANYASSGGALDAASVLGQPAAPPAPSNLFAAASGLPHPA